MLTCDGVSYRLQKTVGGGGSGDVWLAEAQDSQWAIKLLKPGTDQKKIERFQREASFQESCSHDDIVRVVGKGEHEGQLYYIMPRYGDTLRSIIDKGDADAGTLLSYIRQIGTALQFAHESGVVHRDVKPENVLVDADSAALADFGIAHFADSTLTLAGDQIGNRDYRAPEQRKGQDARLVGAAADVYALGLIINECFTREIPAGPSYRSIEESYPLMSYLDSIVERMLAQSPDNRPAMADVLTDIRFFEAKKNDEIADVEEALRFFDKDVAEGTNQLDEMYRRASEDVWYAAGLLTSKTTDELDKYNLNWRSHFRYDAGDFLRNLCVQSRLIETCQRKFDYESSVYKQGRFYKPLDVDGDPRHRELYNQVEGLLLDHRLPPDYDLSGRILKTFASCVDYHCAEILKEARQISSQVDENLIDAPILWMIRYLASYVPSIMDVDCVVDCISINWERSESVSEIDDDSKVFTQVHPALDPEPVLKALRDSWDVATRSIDEDRCVITFQAPGEYQRFREHALNLAEPETIMQADVMDLFRDAVRADGITQLTLSSTFDVCVTLAKILDIQRSF